LPPIDGPACNPADNIPNITTTRTNPEDFFQDNFTGLFSFVEFASDPTAHDFRAPHEPLDVIFPAL
jgi:hypothetical protein